jgi:Ca2+-binding RTX toxin-like protein
MNQQDNHEVNQMASLADLPVTEERAEETKGGLLRGGSGRDVLLGGSGDDVLIGGAGLDVLIGNTGGDR